MAVYRPKYKGGGRSPIYSYEFVVNGVRYKGSTHENSKEKARAIEDERKVQARNGHHTQKIEVVPFNTLANQYLELHVGPNLKRAGNYKHAVRLMRERWAKRMVPSITPLDCDKFMSERSSKSDSTYNLALTVMKSMFGKAVKWHYRAKDDNPAAEIESKDLDNERERAPTADEVETLRGECDEWLGDIVLFSFLSGGRSDECRSLLPEDVHLDTRPGRSYLTFRHTKTKRNRDIPLGPALRGLLWNLPTAGFKGAPRVFLRGGKPITNGILGHHFRAARRKAGLDWMVFHDLRAGWATAMAEAGVPLKTLMEMAGWTKSETAMRYMRKTKYSRQLSLEAQERAFGGSMAEPHESPTEHAQIV